ncbi:MAG: TonB-dependent receptor [Calditrichaeota bacterium]|nr:MAG: TonB-dependent receptor [Calditrichota bacterium]
MRIQNIHIRIFSHTLGDMIKYVLPALFLILVLFQGVYAEGGGVIYGKVLTPEGEPLPGVSVYLKGTHLGDMTNSAGEFRIENVVAGEYTLVAEFVGRESREETITIANGKQVEINFQLSVVPISLPGIVVTTSRGGDLTETMSHLPPTVIQRSEVSVTGELLRQVPGVEAVRRGPTGLDPVVRGLRETEVGTYVDGTRYFPAGPARMDSPLSHYDPTAIHTIHIVKGPYALTWGAGNLSAIQAESEPLQWGKEQFFHGHFITGYRSNSNSPETAGAVIGTQGIFSYWLHANWRESHDYHDGAGNTVPADFHSREIRGKLGIRLTQNSRLTFSGGYQYQNDIDYPGRLLNARFFKVRNLYARYQYETSGGLLRFLEVTGYVNDLDHLMDNNGKPTAEANPNRMPPFPLLVKINSGINVKGGRVDAKLLTPGDLDVEIGGDLYSANRDASRDILRRDNGMVMMKDDIVWPDATIRDGGLFIKGVKTIRRKFRFTATLRSDFVHADADTASDFFLQNISRNLSRSETNLSGAVMLEVPLTQHWLVSAGFGSAVRTADANERYSDRFPASKAQTSAEFMGNPALNPERNTQADIWIEAAYSRFSFHVNGFVRKIDNFITLEPTGYPKKLPLSPNTVFQYINGDANFRGGEAAAVFHVNREVRIGGVLNYLWGKDETLDEPALGVAPLNGNIELAYHHPENQFFFRGLLYFYRRQNRVAVSRGEIPTPGYVTVDIQVGARLLKNSEIRAGVINLTDKTYSSHLNAKNPFTGIPIPEPGRTAFLKLSLSF